MNGAPTPRRSRLRAAASWLGALAVSVLFTELVLTALDVPSATDCRFVSVDFASGTFRPDPDRFWRLSPDAPDLVVNPLGLRGWWPTGPKEAREYRVACIGDSCTFGAGVRYEDTYGVRLAELLQQALPDRDVHCALLALPGYSTYQSRVLVAQQFEFLCPDLVVLYCGTWNDYLPRIGVADAAWAQRLARDAAGPRIARVLRRLGEPRVTDDDVREIERQFREGRVPGGCRVPLADYHDNLAAMVAGARAHGSRVVMVLPPLPDTTTAKFPIALEYRVATRALAAELDVVLCDMAGAMTALEASLPAAWRSGPAGVPATFVDWAHPSILGHTAIARVLFGELLRAGFVPREPSPDAASAPGEAPVLTLGIAGSDATMTWPRVPGATGYLLLFAEEPRIGPVSAEDMGFEHSHFQRLWPGANYLTCVVAYNQFGPGPISAPVLIAIPSPAAEAVPPVPEASARGARGR